MQWKLYFIGSSEEVSDQDTDNNVVECEESFCVLYFKMYIADKSVSNLFIDRE